MAFLSFLRRAFGGQIPPNDEATAMIDGQFTLDTDTGYLYTDISVPTDKGTSQIKRIPIADRRDSIQLYSIEDLKSTTHNGWYHLDLDAPQTIPVSGYDYGVTINRHAYLLVTGTNKKQITQTLFTHSDEGRILIRHSNYKTSEENAIDWGPWQIQDKITTINGSLCQTQLPAGNYYVLNTEDIANRFAPAMYGYKYDYNYYFLIVQASPQNTSVPHLYTYYPLTSIEKAPAYIQQYMDKVNGKWQVVRTKIEYSSYAIPLGKNYNLNTLQDTGIYYLTTDINIPLYNTQYPITQNSFIEVKHSDNNIIQTLTDIQTHNIFSRINNAEWELITTPKGLVLPFGKNAQGTSIDNTLNQLPTGHYIISQDAKAEVNISGVSKPYIIPSTARLTVERFHERYCKQTLYFESDSKLNILPSKTECAITRICKTITSDGKRVPNWSAWQLENDIIAKDVSIQVNNYQVPTIIAALKTAMGTIATGSYSISTTTKNANINDFKFAYAKLRVERYGTQLKLFLYPIQTGTNYALMATCKDDGTSVTSDGWRWDSANFPKVEGKEYPLADGTYYYKGKISRTKYTNVDTSKTLFYQIYKGSGPVSANDVPIAVIKNLPGVLNNKKVNIQKISTVADFHTVTDNIYPSVLRIINPAKVKEDTSLLTIGEYLQRILNTDLQTEEKQHCYVDDNGDSHTISAETKRLFEKGTKKEPGQGTFQKFFSGITTPKLILGWANDSQPTEETFMVEFYYTK